MLPLLPLLSLPLLLVIFSTDPNTSRPPLRIKRMTKWQGPSRTMFPIESLAVKSNTISSPATTRCGAILVSANKDKVSVLAEDDQLTRDDWSPSITHFDAQTVADPTTTRVEFLELIHIFDALPPPSPRNSGGNIKHMTSISHAPTVGNDMAELYVPSPWSATSNWIRCSFVSFNCFALASYHLPPVSLGKLFWSKEVMRRGTGTPATVFDSSILSTCDQWCFPHCTIVCFGDGSEGRKLHLNGLPTIWRPSIVTATNAGPTTGGASIVQLYCSWCCAPSSNLKTRKPSIALLRIPWRTSNAAVSSINNACSLPPSGFTAWNKRLQCWKNPPFFWPFCCCSSVVTRVNLMVVDNTKYSPPIRLPLELTRCTTSSSVVRIFLLT